MARIDARLARIREFETKNMGIFQLAVRDVVEAHGGMGEISSKMEVS